MTVAVTGGSGVVGSAVIRHLVEDGHQVNALARSTAAGSVVAALGANPVPGDVLDPASLDRLTGGCRLVFHVAGVNELCTRDPKWMWNVNVEGTRLVMNACRRSGVDRMVHTSSAVTMRAGRADPASEYERSKTAAEGLVLANARDLDVVLVNPTSVQGPGRATGTGALLLDAARGRLRYLVDTSFSLVDVNDCARAHLLAAEKGASGERYLLSGATLGMREAVRLLNEATGRNVQPRYLSGWQLEVLGYIGEISGFVSRQRPPICRETVRVMTQDHRYDGSRAEEELGFRYTPVEQTISETLAWFRQEGLLTSG